MALLQLKDIGKIYVSESNVAVGIRGVNLSFERGEFVAITGKSGSGKSTLLNVISGMDTYEEGELFVEGQPTSHYLQPEWEDYREKYISFIFQDYNIIDSLTVLQNVELALMHIEDVKERRARALALIDRVGLRSHVGQKGSKLSGGQKQRTVIARALAKDSPIILADEPTGNLDSRTSAEIVELLKEVSRDKLLIVVTHNFEQVEAHATRHIRIFDGAVESDTVISAPVAVPREQGAPVKARAAKNAERKKDLKNGLILGRTIFTAKPRLSLFLCLLMIIGTLGVFMVTTLSGEAGELFAPNYMFTHIDGRVIVTTQSGEVISEDEVRALAEKYGAKDYLRVDSLLDMGTGYFRYPYQGYERYLYTVPVYGEDFGKPDIGSYPTKNNEVLLYLPISYQDDFGKDSLLIDELDMQGLPIKISGIRYYYDNNLTARCLFTEEGFRTATAVEYILNRSSTSIVLTVTSNDMSLEAGIYNMELSFDVPSDKIYVSERYYAELLKTGEAFTSKLTFAAQYYNWNFNFGDSPTSMTFLEHFDNDEIEIMPDSGEPNRGPDLVMSDEMLQRIASEVLERSYTQASLFFENDKEAHKAASAMRDEGYIAVPSDTEYVPGAEEAIRSVAAGLAVALVWFVAILFLAFFINLCSARALGAFKGDMAIMRSMGIPVQVIRIAMYVRMTLALIPGFICMAAVAVLIFTSPAMNEFFVYLYAWQYGVIALGMLLLTVMITRKQVRRLFNESVKKSLKGDGAQ